MRTFFIPANNITEDQAIITGDEAKHLRKVLRLGPGDLIMLIDGTGVTYKAQISEVGKAATRAIILQRATDTPPPPYLHLGQAVLKKKKMELLLQKTTELGVSTIQPFISQHCSLTYDPDSQSERWHKIIIESCKQCKRATPPQILPTISFDNLLAGSTHHEEKILLWEDEPTNRFSPFPNSLPRNISLLIGPEGGFSQQEITKSRTSGFQTITLGPRTLRAETAAIAAITISQYLLHNF